MNQAPQTGMKVGGLPTAVRGATAQRFFPAPDKIKESKCPYRQVGKSLRDPTRPVNR